MKKYIFLFFYAMLAVFINANDIIDALDGNIRTYQSFGDITKRHLYEIRANYSQDLNPILSILKKKSYSTRINVQAAYLNSKYTTQIEQYLNNDRAVYEKSFSNDYFRLRELYLEDNLTDSISYKLGKQTIIWGQFDVFSPIDFLLPIEFSSLGLNFTKTENRLPQNAAFISWFITDTIELQGYYFPDLTIDGFAKQYLDEGNSFYEFNSENINNMPYRRKKIDVQLPSKNEDNQQALRLFWYGSSATIGLTVYDGWWQFPEDLNENAAIYQDTSSQTTMNYYSHTKQSKFLKRKAIGVEIAKPIRNFVFKIESVYTHKQIRWCYDTSRSFESGSEEDLELSRYYQHVINNNQGKLYVTPGMFFTVIGFDAEIKNFQLNAGVGKISMLYDSDEKEVVRLSQNLEKKRDWDQPWMEKYELIGSLNLTYFLSDEKNHSLGLAAGILGNGSGLALYYGKEFFDSITFGISYQYITLFADQAKSGYITDEGIYEEEKEVEEPSIAFGVSYKF